MMLHIGLLLLCSIETEGERVNCSMVGKPEYPLLSNDGDFIIGGAFSIHSKINLEIPSFTQKPHRLMCTRFVTSAFICYIYVIAYIFCNTFVFEM